MRIGPLVALVGVVASASCGSGAGTGTEWERIKARYGQLSHLAGKGATDSRVNEWLPGFEGGPAPDAELSRPHFAMADLAGNVYIADKEGHAIRKVTPGGTIVTVAGTGQDGPAIDEAGPALMRSLSNPNGLFVLGDGTLYILDLGHARIRKVSPDGVMTTLFSVDGGLDTGRGLWVAANESEVFVSSRTVVKRWTRTAEVQDWATGFADLGNLARDRGGRLLVSDRGASRVYAVTAQPGQPATRTVIAGSQDATTAVDGGRAVDALLAGVRAVWPAHPDDGEGFFIGTHQGCQVWYVDGDGILHLFLDGARDAHAGDGQRFDSPGQKVSELRSVSLDDKGNLLFVEDNRGFVRMVQRR